MRRFHVLVASLLLVGCPDEVAPPPPPVTPVTPTPPPVTSTPRPTQTTESAVAPTSEAPAPVEPEPTLVTVTPPAPPALGERVRLGSGRLLTSTTNPDLRVGGAGVRDGLAQLEVLIGGFCYSVEAAAGDVISVGPALLAVDELETASPGAAFVRWEREAPPGAPLLLEAKARESEQLLREQALYKLDGGVVGVGDVRETRDGPRVTLTIFPADYESDPGMGYARDVRVVAGALVGVDGPGPKFRLLRVTARSAGQRWGTVVLGPP